jgi:hypothetical protein
MKAMFKFLLVWLFLSKVGFSQTYPSIMPVVSTGGLQVSLTTSGSQFTPGLVTTTQNSGSLQANFLATATISNRSKSIIPLMFANKYQADQGWVFSLYKDDKLVWTDARVYALCAADYFFPIRCSLTPGRSLTKTVSIPLADYRGVPWAAGEYVLEACLLSNSKIKSSVVVCIQPTYEKIGTINGVVRQPTKDSYGNHINPRQVFVIVSPSDTSIPLNGYNSWTGVTDNKGLFKASLLAGTYSVKAYIPGTSVSNSLYTSTPVVWGDTNSILTSGSVSSAIVELKIP